MRFRKKSVHEINEHLTRLGLSSCVICGSADMHVHLMPTIVQYGGFHHEPPDPRHDPEANVIFAVQVRCEVCGHLLLFDSEKFRGPNEKMLVHGMTLEEEERIDPPDE